MPCSSACIWLRYGVMTPIRPLKFVPGKEHTKSLTCRTIYGAMPYHAMPAVRRKGHERVSGCGAVWYGTPGEVSASDVNPLRLHSWRWDRLLGNWVIRHTFGYYTAIQWIVETTVYRSQLPDPMVEVTTPIAANWSNRLSRQFQLLDRSLPKIFCPDNSKLVDRTE